ncbi:MAG TPA: CheR family methyltransferase [Casimicrobiaceae bacterium]|nr:CheR family methyltransferase [Casimicrobiaceae bacterium]
MAAPHNDFLVVGIGASAGGVDALQKFFANVRPDSGMAYVVVLHLSPDHESELGNVLQHQAAIPVLQVSESVRVEPNHAYVLAPNRSLHMRDDSLELAPLHTMHERRAPIDIFFRTLAVCLGSRAACVVLSGTGADGSMGMKSVKEYGGVCLVQDPAQAQYSDMPRHCIATGLVDYVLPVEQIPGRLATYLQQLKTLQVPGDDREPSAEHVPLSAVHEAALRAILTALRTRTGHDFTNYKRSTLLRRIARRMSVRELPDLMSYAAFLRDHLEETQPLLKDLLISVTNFFRDPEAWQALEAKVIPKLFSGKSAEDYVRVWVAGCATGEEAYSVAMLLAEHAATLAHPPSLQVFATDLDEAAIAFAREGVYTATDTADVPAERLRRFFAKENEGHRINRDLREMVLFAHHNLIKDPPFSHLDLATCRNLLIYLNRTAQRRVLDVLHFALNPGGYLFVGASESVEGGGDLFVDTDVGDQIFQRRAVEPRLTFPVPDTMPPLRAERARVDVMARGDHRALERLSYADLHQRLLEKYAPPSLVVNEEQEIVHMSPRAGRYMQVAGGEPSHNLLKLIRPELRLELRTALHEARQRRTAVEARNVVVQRDDGSIERVNVTVRPVWKEADTARGFALVMFTPATEGTPAEERRVISASEDPVAQTLEQELNQVKTQLRASVEQWEIQTEELRASNEELQAMNEELSSAAEELETRKEELQSVNEELTTVNQELKTKIEELSQSNNDIRNLINSTDIGTVFLDRTLSVKMFTPRARDVFSLIAVDLGRPLADIRTQLIDGNLTVELQRVLDTLQPVQREVTTQSGSTFMMNIVPYRTGEDRIEGVVLTFLDISDRRKWEQERENLLEGERAARVTAEGATRLKDEFLATLSHEMRTPLSVIASWSQLLDAKFAHIDPQLRRGLGLIGSSAFALSQLISDLLDIARVQTGKLTLDMRSVDLREITMSAVQAQRPDAERKHITLGFTCEVESAPIIGDRTRLQQVLWNLISNAIKFTPAGGSIDVLLLSRKRDYEVCVKDTGSGIAADFLPRVFDRFSQADSSTSRGQAGLGLGLAIVKELVGLHGGTVHAESRGPGLGSVFTVRLPAQLRTPERGRERPSDSSEGLLRGVKALVVDDAAELLESIKRELEYAGAEVVALTSSVAALDALAKQPAAFDVLVADIGMPELDGYQLIGKVRKDLALPAERLPALALTAFARDDDRRRALASGYQAHVAKPYRAAELVRAIAQLAASPSDVPHPA